LCGGKSYLEEEHDHQHAQSAPVGTVNTTGVGSNGSRNEDHDEGLESEEHVAGLSSPVHYTSGGKATNGEKRLSD
jgi:hypothetical protein